MILKPLKFMMILLALSFVLSSCYKATFVEGNSTRAGQESTWTHFFFWGLAGSGDYNVKDFCPAGISKIRTKSNFGNLLVTLLTIGIYSPRKVSFTCKTHSSAKLEYDVYLDKNNSPIFMKKFINDDVKSGMVYKLSEKDKKFAANLKSSR